MEYTIRKANLSDIDEVMRLYKNLSDCMISLQKNYIGLPEKYFDYYNEDNGKYFESVLVSDDHVIFIAEVKNNVVGYIQACIHEKDFAFDIDKYCYIPYHYTEEAWRNYSLNIDLYKKVEKWAYEKELSYICSDVDGGNDISLKLQKKLCGMKPYKIRLMKQL